MEGQKIKKTKATASKTKRVTQSKSPTPKRKVVVRTAKKSKKISKKITDKKALKKTVTKKTKKVMRVVSTPVVDSITKLPASRVSALTQPLTVQAIASPMLKPSAYVHPWSLRHNVTVILSLTLVAIIAMVTIAVFTQTTLSDIESLNTASTTLMKPTASETRFFTTSAGEIKLTLPTTWSVTDHTDDTIIYKHATLSDAQIQVQVTANDEKDVASWLEGTEPAYEGQIVVKSTDEVAALRGVTVHATNENDLPIEIVYLPIQKNLRERYIVAITAQVPLDSDIAVKEALADIISNFQVE